MQQLIVISLWLLIVAADLRYRRIPKALNFALLALLLPLGKAFCAAAMIIWTGYLLIFRLSGGAIGYGDVRLAPATAHFLIGGGLSWGAIITEHCLAWSAGGVHAILIYRRGARTLPFAPYLLLAGLIYQASTFNSLR